MRAVVGMIVLEVPTPWAADADDYLRKGLAVHDRFKAEALVTTAFAPHAPYSVSAATLARVRRLADELERPVHIHVHETAAEVAETLASTGQRPLAQLEALGLVTPLLNAVHATQLTAAEIDLLAASGAHVVHCPRSNMKLASGACPAAALLAAGVNVALGTDGAASNNRLDMLAELDAAALLGKHVAGNAEALPAATVVEMATLNGARALGLASEIGSLVAGKAADLVCVDLSAPELAPVLDPLSQLVYSASREHVSDVWVAGEHLVVDGALARLDAARFAADAQRFGHRLLAE
jgi:5-methylthioadenosine/S-adenosylhomocysteine deaminase